jgi:hypothetical protein
MSTNISSNAIYAPDLVLKINAKQSALPLVSGQQLMQCKALYLTKASVEVFLICSFAISCAAYALNVDLIPRLLHIQAGMQSLDTIS